MRLHELVTTHNMLSNGSKEGVEDWSWIRDRFLLVVQVAVESCPALRIPSSIVVLTRHSDRPSFAAQRAISSSRFVQGT